MALSKRTQLYVTPEQWNAVEREAQRLGVSAAEVVRRALDALHPAQEPFSRVLDDVAGSWSAFEGEGTEFVARIRGEWAERHGR